jgi:hypothetical protein
MKLAVLVLANDEICVCSRCIAAGRRSSYTKMVKACRETWAVPDEDTEVFYIYGHRDGINFPVDAPTIKSNERYWPDGGAGDGFLPLDITEKFAPFAIEDCIYSDTPEGRENIYYKTIDGFQWLLENVEFDYVLRTNCGTYIDLELLKQNLRQIGIKDNIYGGSVEHYQNSHNPHQPSVIKFASGSAFLASRNLIKDLVDNRNNVDLVCSPYASKTIGDDVTFAKRFLYEKQADFISWHREDITSQDQISDCTKDMIQCYYGHTINPDLIYATHRAKVLARSMS